MGFMTDILQPSWSRNATLDESETVASRFERQVTADPDKLAIVTDEISLTYRALDLKASRVAAALSFPKPWREQSASPGFGTV